MADLLTAISEMLDEKERRIGGVDIECGSIQTISRKEYALFGRIF